MTNRLDISDLVQEGDDLQIITNGEAAILQKLSELQESVDELIEKVNNLNLIDNSGLSIENY